MNFLKIIDFLDFSSGFYKDLIRKLRPQEVLGGRRKAHGIPRIPRIALNVLHCLDLLAQTLLGFYKEIGVLGGPKWSWEVLGGPGRS